MPDRDLPPKLRGTRHWDWPWPFSRIRRGWTAFKWGTPRLAAGSCVCAYPHEPGHHYPCPPHRPKPIAPPGTWHIARFPGAPWWAWPALYFSWSGRRANDGKFRNVRVGPRWDDVDNYVNWTGLVFPFLPSSRRYTGGDEQDTGTS